jgi:hypothetical protein
MRFKGLDLNLLVERRTFVDEWLHNRYGDVLKIAAIAPNFTLVPPSVVGTNHVAAVPVRLASTSPMSDGRRTHRGRG